MELHFGSFSEEVTVTHQLEEPDLSLDENNSTIETNAEAGVQDIENVDSIDEKGNLKSYTSYCMPLSIKCTI